MRSEGQSVFMSKAEIWTLLAFAGVSAHFAKVHFRIGGGGKLDVGASSGKTSVTCRAKAEKAEAKGKWALPTSFLERGRAMIQESTESLRIDMLGPDGKPRIYVIETESGDEGPYVEDDHETETDAQLTLDEILEGIQVPDDGNYRGSWCAFDPEALTALKRLKVAVDSQPITQFPPATATQAWTFEVHHSTGHWKAAVLPEKVLGPGGEREAPPAPAEGAPGDPAGARQARLDLEQRANGKGVDNDGGSGGGDDGIVDDDYEPEGGEAPLGTEKPRKGGKGGKAGKGRGKS